MESADKEALIEEVIAERKEIKKLWVLFDERQSDELAEILKDTIDENIAFEKRIRKWGRMTEEQKYPQLYGDDIAKKEKETEQGQPPQTPPT